MDLKTTKLRDAIVFALVIGATGFAGSALAQQAPADQTKQGETAKTLDAIVVTGSRIQSQTVTASSPVTEIDQEEFQFTGATRTEDLVNQYPQMSPAFDSFTNNGATGYPTVDLRGLGAGRTLTLVNGLRLAPGAAEAADISIIPAFMIKRVDILTGGASAVYGSDAIGGVVNFILDNEFEGVKFNVGTSGYQHNNDNKFIQGKLAARNFDFPSGGSGIDGRTNNFDAAVGGRFGDGQGHAMAWLTYRKNDALFQGQRDYSSCALNEPGTGCGGSDTNAAGNFYFYQPGSDPADDLGNGSTLVTSQGSLNPDGSYKAAYGAPYNYAPINYYQRPDERYTFGSSLKYEINEHFKPYLETMYIIKKDAVQIAPSGAFFTDLQGIECDNPLIGSACADLGIDPANGAFTLYVAKRNVEGGPRISKTNTSQFRVVAGVEGSLVNNWSYNASFLYGETRANTVGSNDFLSSRIRDGLLGCPAGSFSGCLPYRIFVPGGVTAAAAQALQGTSLNTTNTQTTQFTGYVTGDTGFGLPWANGENVSLVGGFEWREDKYDFNADSDSQAGNFAGAGGPSLPVAGKISVREFFAEAAVPLVRDMGVMKALDLELAYRTSSYNLAGNAQTFKVGFTSDFGGMFRARGGYNRAIRAPGINALFSSQQLALFSGTDPCAGETPEYTQAQCANTGVSADRYGKIPTATAGQYNQFIGGNLNLKPETADTYTLGFVVTPTNDLRMSVDYYDIGIKDTISTVGAQTILNFCGLTGDPTLCALVKRSGSGDLFRGSNPATSGQVVNLTNNFGKVKFRGVDLSAFYAMNVLGGRLSTSFQGNYLLEQQIAPLAGVNEDATYDCVGKVNSACQSPKWRHIANARFSRDWLSVNLRWRYFGSMDYVDQFSGAPLFKDKLLCSTGSGSTVDFTDCLGNQKVGAYNYFDLSASALVGTWGELTIGVNNIADKAPPLVGSSLGPANGNSLGGYDQAGRFLFTSFTVKF